ncbi:MAG: hypothetical protein H6813_06365 [Phycisphaeraceae bacterium]|nr:hypothetical protein [Phycisphaeraceae bacterium]MCB9848095.1 hypothetical protein [Phycisphaeraceae bacterium]
MQATNPNKPSPIVPILVVLCLALGALVVLLALKSRRLTAEVSELRAAAQVDLGNALGAGQRVEPMILLDPQGSPVPLSFEPGNGAVLLLLSSGSCNYCEEARPIWSRIAEASQSDRLRVVGLVTDADPEQLAALDLPFDLYTPGGDATAFMSRIPGVPAALLIDEQGIVIRAFYGEQAGLEQAVAGFLARGQPAAGAAPPQPAAAR